MNFVTVATFTNAFNANVVKGRLDSEGIPAFIKDEHTVTMNPFYNGALGGIKLQVSQENEGEARRLLAELGYVSWQPHIVPEEKQPHVLVQFFKFILWSIVVLSFLYMRDNM
jgi:hypothetical protein